MEDLEEQKQHLKGTGIHAVMLLLVMSIVIAVVISFSHCVKIMIENQNRTYLIDEARQSEKYLSTIFLNSRTSINSIAMMYEMRLDRPEIIAEDLADIRVNSPFTSVQFASVDGSAVNESGTRVSISDRDYYQRGMRGESDVAVVFDNRFDGGTVFMAYAPLHYNGEIIGVMLGVHSEEWLTNLLKRSAFDKEITTYLCLRDGTMFATSFDEHLERHNTLEFFQSRHVSPKSMKELRKCFEEGESCFFSYTSSDGGMDSAFAITNERKVWVMIQTFPHSITDRQLKSYKSAMLKMEGICFIIFMVYVAYIMASELKRRKIHDAMSQKAIRRTSLDLADTVTILSDYYYKVLKINLCDDSFSIIKINESERMEDCVKTSQWIERFAETGMVFKDDVAKFKEFFNPKKFIERLTEGERSLYVRYRRMMNGEPRWVKMEIMKSAEFDLSNPIAVLYVLDIDDDVRKELALEEAYNNAMKANKAKTAFLSNMSHDIRTPMNAIIGMTAIAAVNLDDRERVEDCLTKITVSSKHLLGLINEVLDMSKIESGRIDLQSEEFNLAGLIDNLLSMTRGQIKAKNHDLSVSIHDIKHELVIGDSQRIQQVFMNLLSNAIKYTPSGGNISISITERPTGRGKSGCYEFIFEDNGIGMSEDYQKHLFEPFWRNTDDERVKHVHGTGLGMTISRNIVQMMNGDIKVESVPDCGTKFTVTIFLKLPEKGEELQEFNGLSVLVVDDDKVSCEAACTILNSMGMRSEWLLSGEEAVELADRRHKAENDFFAIIIDWKMPGMNGMEVAREIRSRVGKDVPIIIISAYDWSEIEAEARAAGADEFVSKPLFKSRLTTLFRKLTGHAEDEDMGTSLDEFKNSDFSGKRALLVEDNEINAEITTEILEMARLDVDIAHDGKEAVDKVTSAREGRYDIIFMDIQMPIMNGYEATQAIRAMDSEWTRRIPIIAMTANTFSDDVITAKNAGMNEHVAKPLDFERLLDTLRRWLKD